MEEPRPRRVLIGEAQSPVVIMDGACGAPAAVIDIAAALAPFPHAAGGYYPGVRRLLTPQDRDAVHYVRGLLQAAGPSICSGFGAKGFGLIEASFSLVTSRPDSLSPPQRIPHFDSVDPDYLAVLHYLVPTAGTAFYRQRATGIERVTEANAGTFVMHAQQDSLALTGYTAASNQAFEQIGKVEGLADRLVIYQGSLLHSGIIPPEEPLSADPRQGRLTTNIFVKARR